MCSHILLITLFLPSCKDISIAVSPGVAPTIETVSAFAKPSDSSIPVVSAEISALVTAPLIRAK